MDSHHPDLDRVRAILRGTPTVADLPELPARPASSAGVTKGRSRMHAFALGALLCLALAAAPLLVLVAIGAWAVMP